MKNSFLKMITLIAMVAILLSISAGVFAVSGNLLDSSATMNELEGWEGRFTYSNGILKNNTQDEAWAVLTSPKFEGLSEYVFTGKFKISEIGADSWMGPRPIYGFLDKDNFSCPMLEQNGNTRLLHRDPASGWVEDFSVDVNTWVEEGVDIVAQNYEIGKTYSFEIAVNGKKLTTKVNDKVVISGETERQFKPGVGFHAAGLLMEAWDLKVVDPHGTGGDSAPSPKTGDASIINYAVLSIMAIGAGASVLTYKKKKNK